jgi:hypothetical protein
MSRDDGFSLIEVMLSSFIAFFVLTALFSVLVASSGVGRIADADGVATQLAQLVVEQARALPYTSVGTTDAPSGQPVGVLPSQEATTYQGLTFTIGRAVIWVNDPLSPSGPNSHDYKQLTVQVSWAGGHTTPIVTFLRDHSNDQPTLPSVLWWVRPPSAVSGQPTVLFSDPVSASTARIWNGNLATPNSYLTTVSASLQASASVVTTTGAIARIEFWCGSYQLAPPWNGSATPVLYPSVGFPMVPGAITTPFAIDLTSRDSSTNALLYPEGLNTVKVIAYSSNLAAAYQSLQFTVDNTAAAFPVGSTVGLALPDDNTDRYNGGLAMTWTPPLDGQSPSKYYDVTIQPNGGTAVTYYLQDIGISGSYPIGPSAPSTFTPTPFSAYRVTLRPRSIRGLTSSTTAVSAYTVNCPRLTGSVFNQAPAKKTADNFRFDLTLATPQTGLAALFGGTSIVYDVYTQDPAGYTYPGSGDLPGSAALVLTDQSGPAISVQSGASCNEYIQVVAKVKNASGTVLATIRSNVIGSVATGPIYQQSSPMPVP